MWNHCFLMRLLPQRKVQGRDSCRMMNEVLVCLEDLWSLLTIPILLSPGDRERSGPQSRALVEGEVTFSCDLTESHILDFSSRLDEMSPYHFLSDYFISLWQMKLQYLTAKYEKYRSCFQVHS